MKKAEKKLKLDAKILAYSALISGALPFIKTPTSDAQIVYSGLKLTRVHANARDSNSTFIDIDGDGTPDFKFQFYHRGLIPFFVSEIKMYGIDGISSKNIHGIGSNAIARTQDGFNLSNDLLIPDAVQSWARSTVLNGKQGIGVACAAGYCFGYWGGCWVHLQIIRGFWALNSSKTLMRIMVGYAIGAFLGG